jgi:succinate--hydroxymethylglutarate CoA-transferase
MDKVFEQEQVLHRQMVVQLAEGTPQEVATVGASVKYSAFEVTQGWSLPPALGEGGEEVARRWLAPPQR